MSTSADATSEALAGSLRTRVGPFEHETRRAYSREPIPSRDLRFSASARWRLASERRRRIIRVKRRLARGRFFHPSHDGEGLPAEEEGGHGARYRPRTSRELEPRASRPRSYRLWSLASRARRGVEISFADPLHPSRPPSFHVLPLPLPPQPSAVKAMVDQIVSTPAGHLSAVFPPFAWAFGKVRARSSRRARATPSTRDRRLVDRVRFLPPCRPSVDRRRRRFIPRPYPRGDDGRGNTRRQITSPSSMCRRILRALRSHP